MALQLNFNSKYNTLDLRGEIPKKDKSKVLQNMTYNQKLKCYQGSFCLEIFTLAFDLKAQISKEIVDALKAELDTGKEVPSSSKKTTPTKTIVPQKVQEATFGYFVKHSTFGFGRLRVINGDVATVEFFFPNQRINIKINMIHKASLPIGTICRTIEGHKCTIIRKNAEPFNGFDIYLVEFENNLNAERSESDLTPTKLSLSIDPLQVISNFQHGGYPIFESREKLVNAHANMVRRGVGANCLLSSRIDLYPHQAYVAGTVILDYKQRYLLADEVGLGKTIEAGIIIHDLLSINPQSNILILCPDSLVQQWFSEMYSKFSGVVFHLPELRGSESVCKKEANQIIISFRLAQLNHTTIISQKWDMIVVDEVHHLLRIKRLYDLVKKLSLQDSGLLLLSALPAQHRDQEYYDLLALLEPDQYNDSLKNKKHFSRLFDRQKEIGGRLGVLNRRLTQVEAGNLDQCLRIIKQFEALIDLPVLKDDEFLNLSINSLYPKSETFIDDAHAIVYHISDYYRINRRILRNRRERLIESKQLNNVQRKKEVFYFAPDQYELDALVSVEKLLHSLRDSNAEAKYLIPLTLQLYQSAIHPTTLNKILNLAQNLQTSGVLVEQYEQLNDLVSYSDWENLVQYLWDNVKDHLDLEIFQETLNTAMVWEKKSKNLRLNKLILVLQEKHLHQADAKFILFAGFPNLASMLYNQLNCTFGRGAIARFYYGLDDDPLIERELKEKEVRKFKVNRETWLLICDETGGEGRNFQFASELIHYDLPWQISKIEQRIGRLDRLGREKQDVLSNLIIAKGSIEDAWQNCLSLGLGIFDKSVSGLEFGLKDIELAVANALLSNDDQALWEMPPIIKDRVRDERTLDETQNQMDEASCERTRADEFRRVQSKEQHESEISESFCNYFKMVSSAGSVKYISAFDHREGIVKFYPEDVIHIELNLPDKRKREGTFYRKIAQERPDLEFYSVGNIFFDSVCHSLLTQATGRTYAVECVADFPTWIGFEFSYRLKLDDRFKFKKFVYQNIVNYLFAENKEYVFVNINNEIFERNIDILHLKNSFAKSNKGRYWKNLTKEKAFLLQEIFPNWDKLVTTVERTARNEAQRLYKERITDKIIYQNNRTDEQIKKLETAQPNDWESQVDALHSLKDALINWNVELDSVGFLSINGGIING